MQTPFRPLLGPPDWQSCDCSIYGSLGDAGVDLIYRRADGAILRVSLVRDSHAATSRFFRETGRMLQAQERELHASVVESEAHVMVDGSSRPVTVGAFAPSLWAARTDDAAALNVSLVADGWPLDDLVLVQVPAEAFPVDEDDDGLDSLDEQYERAEAQYLAAIRLHRPRDEAASLAQSVAESAAAYNAAAYTRLHNTEEGDERLQLDLLTERTEVLAELWADLAAAYR